MRVLISGGSGYIGRRLAGSLAAAGHDVVSLSRRPEGLAPQSGVRFVKWDARTAEGDWVNELAGAQGVVNLAGASIGKGRWTRRRMAEILSSRLSATSAIVQAIKRTPADRRDAVEARPSAAGDEALRRLGSGHEALIRHSLEREVEHAGPDLHPAVSLRGDFLDDAEAVAAVVGEREEDVEPVIGQRSARSE